MTRSTIFLNSKDYHYYLIPSMIACPPVRSRPAEGKKILALRHDMRHENTVESWQKRAQECRGSAFLREPRREQAALRRTKSRREAGPGPQGIKKPPGLKLGGKRIVWRRFSRAARSVRLFRGRSYLSATA